MTKEQKYKKVLEKIKYLIENSIGINPLLYKIHKLVEEVLQ